MKGPQTNNHNAGNIPIVVFIQMQLHNTKAKNESVHSLCHNDFLTSGPKEARAT